MEKQTTPDSRQTLFIIKILSCLFGLLLIGLMFAPMASMQNSNKVVGNKAVVVNNMRRMSNIPPPTPELPKSTVRGRVFYEDTGRVVKRASIMLMGKDGRGREISGLTDNDGNFEMKDVPAGTYYAFVNAPGVISPLAFADMTKPRSDGFEDAVENFQPIITNGLSDIYVQIPAKRGGAISGRVSYSDGDSAIGVKVEILRKVKERFLPVIPNLSSIVSLMGGGAGSFQTDDRGVYRFAGLPAGEYIVKVTESASHSENKEQSYNPFGDSMFGGGGYSLLTTYFPDASDTKKAQIVNVALGQEQSEINVMIPDRDLFRVEGKIIAAKDKSPVKNARVSLKRDNDTTFSIFDEFSKRQQTSVTDDQGNWSFREMPKGNYKIVVEPPRIDDYESGAYMSNTNSYMSNRAAAVESKPKLAKKVQEISLEDKSLSEIVIELGYGAAVSGTVALENSQEMPTSVTIMASKDDDEAGSSTIIYNFTETGVPKPQKINHDFKLESIAEGKTNLGVFINNDDFYVKSAMFNGTDLIANPLELKEGEIARNVQIILSKDFGTIKGKVLNGENLPAAKTEFLLVPADAAKRKNASLIRTVKTDENGEFEVKIAPNEYAIIFLGENNCAKRGEECNRWFDEAVKNASKITVKSNETGKVSLSLPK